MAKIIVGSHLLLRMSFEVKDDFCELAWSAGSRRAKERVDFLSCPLRGDTQLPLSHLPRHAGQCGPARQRLIKMQLALKKPH